jgi:hypothetical protein
MVVEKAVGRTATLGSLWSVTDDRLTPCGDTAYTLVRTTDFLREECRVWGVGLLPNYCTVEKLVFCLTGPKPDRT